MFEIWPYQKGLGGNGHRSMFFGIAGHLEEGLGEVAVAFGIFVEVVLMVVLSFIEITEGLLLYGEGLGMVGLLVLTALTDDSLIGRVGEIDAGAVLGAFVMALTVDADGVDGLEIHTQEEGQADNGGVIDDADGLGIAGLVCADVLVGGAGGVAVGVADLGVEDSLQLLEIMLGAPEAATGKVDLFGVHRWGDWLTLQR